MSTYKAKQFEEQSRRARFQEQCFLLFHRYQIREALEFKTRGTRTTRQQRKIIVNPKKHRVAGSSKKWGPVFNYDHIVTLNSEEPEILASQINALDGAEIFFNLDAAVLSQLKPIVELYKVYPNRKKTTAKNKVEVPFRVPFLLGEGIKDGDLEQGRDRKGGFAAIDELFVSHQYLGNVMPHNFRIKFAGKDIAWVNVIDSFSFSLSFSSFRLFNHKFKAKDPNGKDIEWSYTDLISTSPMLAPSAKGLAPQINSTDSLPSSECPFSYESVPGPKGKATKVVKDPKNLNLNPNPDYFEIQAVIRYDSEINWKIAEDLNSQYSKENKAKLQNFLRGSALVTRLNFKEHTIRYAMGESGGTNAELILDLDYAARLEGVLNSPELDLLTLNSSDEKDIQILETDLAYARRLLAEIRSKDLSLDAALAGKTIKKNGKTFDNDYAKMYVRLRKNLVKRMGHYGQWLIKLPVDKNNNWLPLSDITVSQKQITIEENRAFGKPRRLARWHPGLNKLEPQEGTKLPSNQTSADYSLAARKHNAILVFNELIEQYQGYIERKRSFYQHERYKRFFATLLTKGRIYKVRVKQEAVGVYKDNITKGATVVAEARADVDPATSWTQAVPGGNVEVAMPDEKYFGGKVIKALQKEADALERAALTSGRGAETLAQLAADRKKLGSTFKSRGGKRMVYFTTFGDIIDHAIDIATRTADIRGKDLAGTWGPGLFKKRIGILFGSLIDDNKIITSMLNNKKNTFTRGKSFNLAHVPISMSLLMGWWIQNVVAKHRKVYSLHQFIRDIIKDLVAKMLGESCVEGAGNRSENIKIINFTSTMKEVGGEMVPPFFPRGPLKGSTGDYPKGGDSRVFLNTTKNGGLYLKGLRDRGGPRNFRDLPWSGKNDVAGQLTEVKSTVPLKNQFNYMLIYVHSYNPKNLNPSDEKGNIRKGIYYLHLGKMTSIIKSCAFTRMEIPYWREMKVAGQTSRTGATMLQDVYDARITLFGNNIFKVGSHVFIDPTKDGAMDFEEWKKLGIGGFFLITEVEHLLLHDGVTQETNLKLRYVTAGGCDARKAQDAKVGTVVPTYGVGADRLNRAPLPKGQTTL